MEPEDLQNSHHQRQQIEEDDDDDSQFSAPMIDASYLRGESQNNGYSQSASQYQNEPEIKDSQTREPDLQQQ